ncbi:hypothetical protein [Microcoleus sp. FACHB-672]|uniref:hypothetical protein n=1 Tax=Microcoleus sp. FACHB-672 TaxID=2692825 RepID=UPI0016861896|nr:hypothetical protein [Microcoleus sp. FACHB-672]
MQHNFGEEAENLALKLAYFLTIFILMQHNFGKEAESLVVKPVYFPTSLLLN